ncbi:ankyrin-3-like [Trichogramma pretiosum]|uniref:ankyrin-3-like n=1 Tax=Trichogramma pretiosum TaxID=7493 RepID=UPI000C71A1FF|nr:ankyrin-3-like [Trichogramma pretiosum]
MAQDDQICLKELKTLRAQVDWQIRKERHKFFLQLYPLVKDWSGQLPNLKDIFRPKEIDWLLTDSMNHCDEPELGEGSKLSLRHTTALHCAARLGPEKFSSESVNELFQIYDRFEVNYTDKRGMTHFHAACKYGYHEVVEKFLELGQDPNCRTKKSGDTPLILALIWGHGRVAELLLRNGAHLHVADEDRSTPLHLICQKKYDFDLVKLFFKIFDEQHQLVKVNARDNQGCTPLHYAVRRDCRFKRTTELLLRRGANPIVADKDGSTPLHLICDLSFDSDEACRVDNDGLLELFFKICDEQHQLVEINARDKSGETPLHRAMERQLKKSIEILLRRGANPKLTGIGSGERTPLHLICGINSNKESAIILKLFFDLNDEIHQSVEVDALDDYGNTPLHNACSCHNFGLAEVLLRRGANPNLVNENGSLPLHLIFNQSYDIHVHSFLKIFFEICAEKNQKVQVDARDKSGRTPLQLALDHGKKKAAEVLLKNGADPNLANEEGSTLLHYICQNRLEVSVVKSLKIFFEINDDQNRQVLVDARDKSGKTPLQLAAMNLLPNAIDILLDHGADLSKFVFPTESDFDQSFREYIWSGYPVYFKDLCDAMVIVERLKKRGYELNRHDALIIMNLFAKYGYFDRSESLEFWLNNEEFVENAKHVILREADDYQDDEELSRKASDTFKCSSLSLYDLILMPLEETEKRFTYEDYSDFAGHYYWCHMDKKHRHACFVHLGEIMLRGFFRSWALEPFLELTHNRLPIICCELIIKNLMNEDLYNICLAAEIASSEEKQNL